MVGYATIYTMAPVFSLVLDRDVNEDLALLYPELYKELTKVSLLWTSQELVDLQISTRAERCPTKHSFNGSWSVYTKVCVFYDYVAIFWQSR